MLALLELTRAADRAGHEVRDVLLVTAEEWVSLLNQTRGPLPAIPVTVDGRRLCDPATAGRLPDPEPAARAEADRRRPADEVTAAAAVDASSPESALDLLAAALAGQPGALGFGVAARVGVLRTLTLALAGWGRDAAESVWPGLTGRAPIGEASFGVQVLCGGAVRRPDAAGLERLVTVLTAAAVGASEDERDDLAAMLAWTHWALGRGSTAARLADTLLQHGTYSDLAVSVAALTSAGRLPEWAFHPDPRP